MNGRHPKQCRPFFAPKKFFWIQWFLPPTWLCSHPIINLFPPKKWSIFKISPSYSSVFWLMFGKRVAEEHQVTIGTFASGSSTMKIFAKRSLSSIEMLGASFDQIQWEWCGDCHTGRAGIRVSNRVIYWSDTLENVLWGIKPLLSRWNLLLMKLGEIDFDSGLSASCCLIVFDLVGCCLMLFPGGWWLMLIEAAKVWLTLFIYLLFDDKLKSGEGKKLFHWGKSTSCSGWHVKFLLLVPFLCIGVRKCCIFLSKH